MINKTIRNPLFAGIYAAGGPGNMISYLRDYERNPQDHRLKTYATRMFRELRTTLTTANLIARSTKPADLHILGASDGSEVYAHAIALRKAGTKHIGNRVTIHSVERNPQFVELARTGHLVMADVEKQYANNSNNVRLNPLAGNGWNRYLQLSASPEIFSNLVRDWPDLGQIERDTVSRISIGNGMNWYKVNTDELPPIEFKQADMREYVQEEVSDKPLQVFVVSNSLSYVFQEFGLKAMLQVLANIRNNNLGKETYLITGDMEYQAIPQMPEIFAYMHMLGYEMVSQQELLKLGADLSADEVFGNVWRAVDGPRIEISDDFPDIVPVKSSGTV